MSIVVEKVNLLESSKDRKRFINLQWSIYKNDSSWVPQLKMEISKLFKSKHPFYETADAAFWIATKDGKDVGRIMATVNHNFIKFHNEQTGHYGFLEAIDDPEVFRALFNTAEEWLKSQGMEKIQGPFNPSTNYECGNLILGHGERPVMMMPYNPEYYQSRIEEQGFGKAKDLIAYHLDAKFEMPEIIKKVSERAENKNNITYRTVSKKDWMKEVDLMYSIYNDAWEHNWGFIPMTKDEFYGMAGDLKMVADERLILFAMVDGKEVGFIVALPDLNQVFHKIPSGSLFPTGIFKFLNAKKYMTGVRVLTMGVKQDYRKFGLASILYQRCHQNILKYPKYKDIEMSWILEDNLNMNKPLIRMNAKPYRKYRIFEKGI
jgi:GNAT superfamily N-acetyltransferase